MQRLQLAALVLLAAGLTACGGATHANTTSTTLSQTITRTTTAATTPTTTAHATVGAGALQAEATASAAGDIPDNQVFVTYRDTAFSMKTPEGWAQTGAGAKVTFRDKNNIARVVIGPGGVPTAASVQRELATQRGVQITTAAAATTIGGIPAIRATYRTTSAPNPVTGKRVTLTIDRYVLAQNGKRATIDLGTPVGVDNVDAYRLMVTSFRFR